MKFFLAWIYRYRAIIGGFVFTAGAATLAHVFWSAAGWNPALDGELQAAARRILAGQTPYRDFIWGQMPLAIYPQIPLLLWCGDNLFLCARAFIWLQLAATAWLWAWMTDCEFHQPLGNLGLPLMAGVAFAGVGFTFAPIDGALVNALLLGALGLAVRLGAPPEPDGARRRFFGYTLMGLAMISALSFWLFTPAVIMILGDRRRFSAWLAAALPLLTLIVYLSATDALYPALLQLWAASERFARYWQSFSMYSIAAFYAYLAMRWIEGIPPLNLTANTRRLQIGAGLCMWGMAGLLLIRSILFSANIYTVNVLFWMLGGAWSYFLLERRHTPRAEVVFGFLVWWLGPAVYTCNVWTGMKLTAGIMSLPLLIWVWRGIPRLIWRATGFTVTAAIWLACSLYAQRTQANLKSNASWTALDAPPRELNFSLTGILAGGAGLNTSSNVQALLIDLQDAVSIAENIGRAYAVIPDMPGHWPRATTLNPLPLDWVANPNLSETFLQDAVVSALEAQRGQIIVIAQKTQGRRLWRHIRSQGNRPPPVAYTRRYFKCFAETKHFLLYE